MVTRKLVVIKIIGFRLMQVTYIDDTDAGIIQISFSWLAADNGCAR